MLRNAVVFHKPRYISIEMNILGSQKTVSEFESNFKAEFL